MGYTNAEQVGALAVVILLAAVGGGLLGLLEGF